MTDVSGKMQGKVIDVNKKKSHTVWRCLDERECEREGREWEGRERERERERERGGGGRLSLCPKELLSRSKIHCVC